MSRGIALSVCRTQLKAELGDALETNSATDTRYNYLLANWQSDLANEYDWSFLKRQWDVSADSGDRYIDLPTADIRGVASTPNFERPCKVDVFYNEFYNVLCYGIGPREYNYQNSDLDERLDPIQRWQVATNTGEAANDDQIEIWPIPDTTQTLRFVGQRQVNAFAVDADKCDLDHLLLVYGVAAQQLALRNQASAGLVLKKYEARLLKVRAGMPSSDEPVVFGYARDERKDVRPMVLAGGRGASSYANTYALGNGVTSGSVVFPSALAFTPTSATLTVTKPAGGLDLFATLVAGTLSGTGFDFTLSGATDSTQYVLNYIVTP